MSDVRGRVVAAADHIGVKLGGVELDSAVELVTSSGGWVPTEEVVRAFEVGEMTAPVLTIFVPRMWRDRRDDCTVSADVWRSMFLHTLYTENLLVAERPKKTVRAYRGATIENRDGIAWSLDPGQAEYFARSRQAPGVADAQVWVTNIPPERILAKYMDGWEKEITADVRDLQIEPLEREGELPSIRRRRWWGRSIR